MDKTHHADDETLEYIASLEQKVGRLKKALLPFASQDECGIGFIVGDIYADHSCEECLNILRARDAIKDTQ